MKAYYISDLHLPHFVSLKENKVRNYVLNSLIAEDAKTSLMIVAGDVSEYIGQIHATLDELSKHYKYVIFVFGNHDLYLPTKNQKKQYHWSSSNKILALKEKLKGTTNVFILDNEVIELDGKIIAGTKLWYSIPEKDLFAYKKNITDAEMIFEPVIDTMPWEIYHKEDLEFYNKLSEVDLLISHVPPIHPKESPYNYDPAFTTTVDFLKAPLWVCGHQHVEVDSVIAGTEFLMNPLGYPFESTFKNFKLKSFNL